MTWTKDKLLPPLPEANPAQNFHPILWDFGSNEARRELLRSSHDQPAPGVAELVKPVKGKNGAPLSVPDLNDEIVDKQATPKKIQGLKVKELRGEPFIQGPGDAAPVDANDVQQGQVGSCYLLAALIGLANQDPERLGKMIAYDKASRTYQVTLYLRDKTGQLKPEVVEVDAGFYVDALGKPIYAGVGDRARGRSELWVMLIEKAYAQHKGGYENIDWGKEGRNMEVLEMLTGNTAHTLSLDDKKPEELADLLMKGLEHGDVMTTVTHSLKDDPRLVELGLVEKHRYAVIAAEADSVTLQNPYGGEGSQITLSLRDFKQHFRDLKYAPTKPPHGHGVP